MDEVVVRQVISGPFAPFGFFEILSVKDPVVDSITCVLKAGDRVIVHKGFLWFWRTLEVTNLGHGRVAVRAAFVMLLGVSAKDLECLV